MRSPRPAISRSRCIKRSADLVGWVAWKYRIPLDRAHILGHDNIPNSIDNPTVQHWDPGPSWDWPYYMDLVRAAYERWSRGAAPPRPEIPEQYTQPTSKIRMITVGQDLASARDWFLWTSGAQNNYTNVYAGHSGPALDTLVRGASDPSTYVPSDKIGDPPTYDKLDFSCDNFPWTIMPEHAGRDLAGLGRRPPRQGGVGTGVRAAGHQAGRRSRCTTRSTSTGPPDGSGTPTPATAGARWCDSAAAARPTTLFSGPEYPTTYLGSSIDTRICPDAENGFSRAGQTYVAQVNRVSQGRTWYQIDYNHRVAWVPADEVKVLPSQAPTRKPPTRKRPPGRG